MPYFDRMVNTLDRRMLTDMGSNPTGETKVDSAFIHQMVDYGNRVAG